MFEQSEDGGADFILYFFGDSRFRIGNQANIALGPVGRFQPTLVTGHMNQNHQQNPDVALGDGR